METSSSSGSNCSSVNKQSLPPWEALDQGVSPWSGFSLAEQEEIARHFAPKVKYLALRLKSRLPRNIELGELISAGTLGLMESFGKFKAELGIKFDTYAESRIRGAMLDELRKLDWFPRSLRRRVRVLDEAMLKLEHQTGNKPTEEALARETGLEIKDVREGLEALNSQFCVSLDLIQDSLPRAEGMHEEEPFAQAAERDMLGKIAELIDQLTPREKLVLSLYYTDELNMREAAEVMGITEGRVSQLHSQALTRLRKAFSRRYGDSAASL
ncbi:FliA/WhiG family RNA polymerase sigma factor [Desulfovibrio cuneatus]|uniref:FliA/WhiG family RNA polymerase sigma factor n=1 Tax=Desulfovibrio cuneatus TaxID=159728 RepID=UPI000480CC29|nr:FliA/WhiG family RNA polymerase sigma factor [Desulfovibrio cuneatus]